MTHIHTRQRFCSQSLVLLSKYLENSNRPKIGIAQPGTLMDTRKSLGMVFRCISMDLGRTLTFNINFRPPPPSEGPPDTCKMYCNRCIFDIVCFDRDIRFITRAIQKHKQNAQAEAEARTYRAVMRTYITGPGTTHGRTYLLSCTAVHTALGFCESPGIAHAVSGTPRECGLAVQGGAIMPRTRQIASPVRITGTGAGTS